MRTNEIQTIERKIFLIRGHKVMFDSELAQLYGVKTKVLLQSVKRNRSRFPSDFMFQISEDENEILRSQFVTLKETGSGRHRKYLPYVFTENGVAMLSSIIRSDRAIQVNIHIMRTFTKLRRWLATHRDLREKLERLERKVDKKFVLVFRQIGLLMDKPEKPVHVKGFDK
jgi:hypothetical protein